MIAYKNADPHYGDGGRLWIEQLALYRLRCSLVCEAIAMKLSREDRLAGRSSRLRA